jgi:integrase
MPCAEDIVLDWLKHTHEALQLKPNDPLFPKTLVEANSETMAFEARGLSREHWANAQPVREIFKKAFKAVGLPYFNPHLFRKTICKWALKNCSQHEFKAISQNLGHDHAMTTYNSYGNLTEDEKLETISNIGQSNPNLHSISTEALLTETARRMGR